MALTVPGIDFAWGTPPYQDAQRAGIKFVMRYISHDAGKDLTRAEAAEWQRRGVKVGVVFESTATRTLAGHAAGAIDATYARDRCNALGIRPVVYFAVDFDANDAQKIEIAKYLHGAASVLGYARVGVYGSYHVIKYCADYRICPWFWQTYAWSGGMVHPAAHIYQYRNDVKIGGVSCDLNHARAIGSYGCVPNAPAAPKPDPRVKKRGIWRQHLGAAQQQARVLAVRIAKLRLLVNRKRAAQK